MPSQEVYLLYDLSVCFETSRLVDSLQSCEVTNAFIAFFFNVFDNTHYLQQYQDKTN